MFRAIDAPHAIIPVGFMRRKSGETAGDVQAPGERPPWWQPRLLAPAFQHGIVFQLVWPAFG